MVIIISVILTCLLWKYIILPFARAIEENDKHKNDNDDNDDDNIYSGSSSDFFHPDWWE